MDKLSYILSRSLSRRSTLKPRRFVFINFRKELVFSRLGEEFRGKSALEVRDALYRSSKKGRPDWQFDDWKEWQFYILKMRYGVIIKEIDTEKGARKWLRLMVKHYFGLAE